MFNVTVINAKKSVIKIIILIGIIIFGFFVTNIVTKFKTSEILQVNLSENLIKCLNSEIPAMESTYYKANNMPKEDGEEVVETLVGKILGIELAKIQEIKQEEITIKIEEDDIVENNNGNIENEEIPVIADLPANVHTEIVTQNLIIESYNTEVNGVKIKNETSFEINNSILETTQNINKENVLIFHTHTCESYTPSEKYQYQQTGNYQES